MPEELERRAREMIEKANEMLREAQRLREEARRLREAQTTKTPDPQKTIHRPTSD